MLRSKTIYGLFVLLILAVRTPMRAAEQPVETWLRGSGKDLEMRLHGEVLNADGKPASGFKLDVVQGGRAFENTLRPTLDGNRFSIWIPVNRQEWYTVRLRAISGDGMNLAYWSIGAFQLRQSAIDGITLTLAPARKLQVQVVGQGAPVSGAHVKAEVNSRDDFQTVTNSDGVATLALPSGLQLSYLTAWTNDQRIGGYMFSRPPTRDSETNEHVVELGKAREERLKFVSEDGTPIPNLKTLLKISSGQPHHNFLGTNEHSRITSDANGEAIFKWYPDWPESNSYAETDEQEWLHVGYSKVVDGVRVFTYTPRAPRKQVAGRVTANNLDTTPGGFLVKLRGGPTERSSHSDLEQVFTNVDGTFTAEVLPDSHYSGAVADSRWVGKFAHSTPFESANEKMTPLALDVISGQAVEVHVISGETKRPVPDAFVQFRHEQPYSWLQDGKEQDGYHDAQWWGLTNKQGIVTTHALPGELQVYMYTPTWRPRETVTVAEDRPVNITLHREVDTPRRVKGRLTVAPEAVGTEVGGVSVSIASLDGRFEDARTIASDAHGEFSFDTFASPIAVLARTADGKASGLAISKNGEVETKQITLYPTSEYRGQLLLKDDRPAAGYRLTGYLRLEGDKLAGTQNLKRAEFARHEVVTDLEGNFAFSNVPSSVKLVIFSEPTAAGVTYFMKDVTLEPGERRPRISGYVERPLAPQTDKTLAERYKATLRDCALGGYRPMIILADDRADVTKFVNDNYVDYEINRDVHPFMQLVVLGGKRVVPPADIEFLKQRGWPVPQPGKVAAIALDAADQELGRLELDVGKEDAAAAAREFVRKHAPPEHDAEAEWNAAFAEAKRTNRRVWVRVSGRYCGPCLRLSRWLDDQQQLLAKDFVMLKVGEGRGGEKVATRVTQGKHHGIPFHAMFDSAGTMLVDSAGPAGNVGYPSGDDGKTQLRKMLLASRQNLTDAEVETLCESVK